ncbi:MAG: hypothetical protein RL630_1623 [Verrucomicrobiota bacterium]|jgi:cytochrome c553
MANLQPFNNNRAPVYGRCGKCHEPIMSGLCGASDPRLDGIACPL